MDIKHSIFRHDSTVISDYGRCKKISDDFSKKYKEYNTVIKVGGGYIATNKYDPRVEIDKFCKINPEL